MMATLLSYSFQVTFEGVDVVTSAAEVEVFLTEAEDQTEEGKY